MDKNSHKITLVLGGVRSGKSLYAEQLIAASGRPQIYLATAEAKDADMGARIAAHRTRRGSQWITLEEPIAVMDIICLPEHKQASILVDCLTLWLSNLMHRELDIEKHVELLLESLAHTQAEIVLVSNDVGLGVMPDNALARRFCDHAGILHQRIAAIAGRVVFMVAGIPLVVKGN